MASTKPSVLARWAETAVGAASTFLSEASSGKKDTGYKPNEYPSPQEMNWNLRNFFTWTRYLQDLEDHAITWTQLFSTTKGLVATNTSATNADAITATGHGTGAGVSCTGGAGGSVACFGQGTGAKPGVKGVGGPTSGANSNGVEGNGGAAGGFGGLFQGVLRAGIKALGSVGPGVWGVGGDDAGVKGDGGDSSPGGSFQGGDSGEGVVATGGDDAAGVLAQGGFSAPGVTCTGGAGAPGITCTGGSNASGAVCNATGTGHGAECSGSGTAGSRAITIGIGHAEFTGTQPTKTANPGGNNLACATNQIKAWGHLTNQTPAAYVSITDATADGYNIASCVPSGAKLLVTFARAMANADYAVFVNGHLAAAGARIYCATTYTTTSFMIEAAEFNGGSHTFGTLDLSTDTGKIDFEVIARQ